MADDPNKQTGEKSSSNAKKELLDEEEAAHPPRPLPPLLPAVKKKEEDNRSPIAAIPSAEATAAPPAVGRNVASSSSSPATILPFSVIPLLPNAVAVAEDAMSSNTGGNPRQTRATHFEGVEIIYCPICDRRFLSNQSYYGHLRVHPDRQWRGSREPPNHGRLRVNPLPQFRCAADPPKIRSAAEAFSSSCFNKKRKTMENYVSSSNVVIDREAQECMESTLLRLGRQVLARYSKPQQPRAGGSALMLPSGLGGSSKAGITLDLHLGRPPEEPEEDPDPKRKRRRKIKWDIDLNLPPSAPRPPSPDRGNDGNAGAAAPAVA